MRVLNAVQRIIMMLLLIPVLIIVLDTLLRAFKAQADNPIVGGVRDAAKTFIIEPFRTVFPDQSYLQDALVTLAAFGLLVLVVVFLFRALRSMVGTKPPKKSAPAPKAAKAPKQTAAPKTEPAPAASKAETTGSSTSSSAGSDKTEAEVKSGSAPAEDDTHSST